MTRRFMIEDPFVIGTDEEPEEGADSPMLDDASAGIVADTEAEPEPAAGGVAPRRAPVMLPEMVVQAPPRQTPRPAPAEPEEDPVDGLLAEVERRRQASNRGTGILRFLSGLTGNVDEGTDRSIREEMQRQHEPDRPIQVFRERQRLQQEQRAAQDRQSTQAREAAASDPQSEQNVRYRQALAQRLPGVPIPETLTIADAETRGLFEGLAQARDREQQARIRGEGQLAAGQQRIEGQRTAQEDQQAFQAEQRERDRALREQNIDIARQRLAIVQARASRRGRGGGGGGLSDSDQRQAFVDHMVSEGRMTPEAAGNAWGLLDRRGRQQAVLAALRAQVGTEHTGERAQEREDVRAGRSDSEHVIPGWERAEGAPTLATAERTALRDANAAAGEVSVLSRRLATLSQRITAAQRAGAAAGVLDPMMAEARGLHEQLQNKLRVVGNYGVPTGTELERMARLAPALDSAQGWASATAQYQTLPGTIDRALAARMERYGYRRAAAGGGGGDTATVRFRGRTLRIPRARLEQAIADGAEVVQ